MEPFLTIVEGWIQSTIIAKSSASNMTRFLNPLLESFYLICKLSITRSFIGIFPKYSKVRKIPTGARISVLQVLAECGKTACEIIVDLQLYWKWFSFTSALQGFSKQFHQYLMGFCGLEETNFKERFLITSLKNLATMIFSKYLRWLLLWILQSSTVWCILCLPFKVLHKTLNVASKNDFCIGIASRY